MLPQTKRAIDSLKECGIARKDFRVNVTRTPAGEYGDLSIIVLRPTEEIVPFVAKLSQHFKVVQYVDHGKVRHVSIREAFGKPGLRNVDVNREE